MHGYDRILFPEASLLRRAVRRAARLVRERAPRLAARLAPLRQRVIERRRRALEDVEGTAGCTGSDDVSARACGAAAGTGVVGIDLGARRLEALAALTGIDVEARRAPIRVASSDRDEPTAPLRGMLVIGSLSAGGAERQLALTAAGLRRRGHDVDVLLTESVRGSAGHHRAILDAVGIVPRVAGDEVDPDVDVRLARDSRLRARGRSIPPFLRPRATDLFGEFLARRPDVVHAWLDHTNIWAGVAAALAGVPAIILGTRNVAPTHMPHLCEPWFRRLYRELAALPGVMLVNNSRAGADDYAAWLDLSSDRFEVIANGVDPSSIVHPDEATVAGLRHEIGVPLAAPLIAGIFRLADEKRPLAFIRIVDRLLQQHPTLHVAHAGDGLLATAVASAVAALPAERRARIHLLGRRQDVPTLIATADLVLLVSKAEGMPNVLLEAQQLGRAVIATDVGGVRETMVDGRTGILCRPEDDEGVVAAADALLRDPSRRARLAREGPSVVAERFGLDRMIAATESLWRRASRSG